MRLFHHTTVCVFILFLAILVVAFQQQDSLFRKPTNFPEPVYAFQRNPVTPAGFALGRKLFYDPILSANGTISCGSCHIQSAAFTHHGHDFSHGIHDQLGTRNTPATQNLAWYTSFFWDGGVLDLDLQPIVPMTNPVEMGDSLAPVLRALNSHPEYRRQFRETFGTDSVTTAALMKALSQFMVMLVSANSKYDQVMRHEGPAFTPVEERGYVLFKLHCSSCHREPLFTDMSYRNNGLMPGELNDEGRSVISLDTVDRYKFKVPSLRNLQYTFPYMHDGRFVSLDEVLNHYAGEMQHSGTIDPVFVRAGNKPGISLSPDDRSAIKAFLQTLNDSAFVRNPAFAEPGSVGMR